MCMTCALMKSGNQVSSSMLLHISLLLGKDNESMHHSLWSPTHIAMIYLCCSPFQGLAMDGDFSRDFQDTSHSGSLPSPGPVALKNTENTDVLEAAA